MFNRYHEPETRHGYCVTIFMLSLLRYCVSILITYDCMYEYDDD